MIQRIQTIFLLLAIIALALFLWMPLINTDPVLFNHPNGLKGYEVVHKYNGWLYLINLILAGTALGLTLVSIFLFKWRDLQMLISWFSIVFIGAAALFVYYEYRIFIYPGGYVILTPWNALAGVAALFEIMAYIYIRKDENTIKSLDRLR
jgi:uncharacterized protein DUF4293